MVRITSRRNAVNNDLTAMKVEESNIEQRELSIGELDNASGGFMWIPVVTVGLIVASIVHKAFSRHH
jgi:hypothetical protein